MDLDTLLPSIVQNCQHAESSVRGAMDEVLDTLVQTCSELKAKTHRFDREKHEIDGKSKTTWLKWGSDFQISVFEGQSDVVVVIDDLAFGANDFFIRDFYKAFQAHFMLSTGYQSRQAGIW